MSYNRLDDDYYESHPMDGRAPHRTPSPGLPLQHGYQLDDNPYGAQPNSHLDDHPYGAQSNPHLDIPMGPGRYSPGDSLQHMQTPHSVENLGGYDPNYHDGVDYAVNPEQHHDAYFNQPYEPHPADQDLGQGYDYDDRRPMLAHNDSQVGATDPYHDTAQTPQPAQAGGIKRWKTVKQVLLYRGNLVLDCPVPPKLLNQLPHGERDEFTHMRYSAATCDPSSFYEENFTLRQKLFSKPRHTELFIVVTMYNEDDILFARTMIGVLKNVEYMCKRSESKTWGKDAWKKIVVCVVSDGRAKINPRTKALLAGMGVYQEGIAKQAVNGKTCLSPDTMVRTTNGDKPIRDIAVGDQLFDHEDRPVQCLAAEAIQTSRMMKVTYQGYNTFSKSSFTCTPDHIMTLVAFGVKAFRHTNTNRLTWWTRCDRTELEADAVEIKWDAVMHDLYTEYREQLGRRPTDAEVRKYLMAITSTRVVPDSEDNDSQRVEETYRSPVLIKLLAKLKAMDVDVDDEDESLVLMLLQQHMEDYLEHMIPEPEDIPDEDNDDLVIDLDANRKRKIGTISTLSSRVSDKTFRQSPSIKSSPADSPQKSQNEVSQSTVSTFASLPTEDDHREMFAPVRNKLAVRHPKCKCQNLSCKGLRRVSVLFETSEQADLALELLSGDHYRVVDPCAVQDMEVFTMTLQEYQATCTAPMTQHLSKLRLYRSPLRFQPYQGPVSPVPIDPYYLGFWLGDGTKHLAEIGSSDPEVEVYTQALVDRLNRDSIPPGKAPLKVSKYKVEMGTSRVYKGEVITNTKDLYRLRVISTVNNLSKTHWNPVLDGLQKLGLQGDKSGGIPDCYMTADENTRLAVLAGLIESDGWLQGGLNCYGFVQYTYEHKKTVEDARKLALSCGIQCNPIIERKNSKDRPEPGWYFYMGRGVEKFQHHLLIPRKRMTIPFTTSKNRDVRPFDVEDAGDGEFRLIEVSGQLFQLADRTVVHNCTAHIYEYTTQVGMVIKNDVVQLVPKQQPVQMLFCLKEKNQKKINSHRWFFQAFGRVLDPNICVLIDAGTRPGHNSIYHLWKAFDLEPMCAGACGEIKAMLGPVGKNLFNPLVATQNFEYKMSNILDKPLESAFGFISVLPGAFSAYRYVALQNDKNGHGPLEKYFAGEKLHGGDAGIFTANMYLAEDRILCFELVTKRNCHWILQYVKSATGETDVPDTVTELILQRRRWLNGSFFAAIYSTVHFHQFFRSDHSLFRKFAFFIEFIFNTVNMIFAWFAIGNFFLVFKILTTSLGDAQLLGTVGKILGVVFEWLYGVSLITCFVLSMGNRPAGSGPYYMAMVIFWAVIFIYLMFAAIYIAVIAIKTDIDTGGFSISTLFKNQVFYTLIVSVMSTYGIWLIASLIMFDPWHMLTSVVQYMLLSPTYTNVLNVYAFCNTHDISWGTKGDDKPDKLPSVNTKDGQGKTDLPDEGDLNAQYERELQVFSRKEVKVVQTPTEAQKAEAQMDYYRGVRTVVVLVWMIMNFALCAVVLSTAGLEKITPQDGTTEQTETQRASIYLSVILWSVAVLSGFKFLGACWFLVVRMFRGV